MELEMVAVVVEVPRDCADWLKEESSEQGLTPSWMGGLMLTGAIRLQRSLIDLHKVDGFRDAT